MTKIDALNDRILRELARDGRVSNLELAERVGLSPSACLRRVQEMERSGVIVGYRAVLDPEATGRGFLAYVLVGLSLHTREAQRGFEQAMARATDVSECHCVAGTTEYILRVECRDVGAYRRFHDDILGTAPHVEAIVTHVVMHSPKNGRG
jgi:Lrp/AsnC family transcriptional regulator, leucine-responsive regulatory protein